MKNNGRQQGFCNNGAKLQSSTIVLRSPQHRKAPRY